MSEYAAGVETLVADMEAEFASLDAEWESTTPSLAGAERYWERRLAIRSRFLNDLRSLDPPEQIADMHGTALDLFARITEADRAVAESVGRYDQITEHRQWRDTPEGRASLAVLEDVFAFCRASQEEFDATEQREPLESNPWLPRELKEVVRVAFGCPP